MSGVYATIEKKPNGTYALNYVLVRRFNARLHQSLNYLLRVPERTRAAKCLNVLKDAIRDCVYIGEAEVCFSNDRGFPFAFGDTRREYLVWSLDGKSIFCVPDSLLLEEAGEEYEDSGTRTFKTRETAEDSSSKYKTKADKRHRGKSSTGVREASKRDVRGMARRPTQAPLLQRTAI